MVKEYLVKVQGCDDSTGIIIRADDAKFSIIEELAERITEASTYACKPCMSIREATEEDKRRLEDE